MESSTESSKPIGIFDSGIGGLTVLKEIAAQLPSENLIYLGDTARVPYGTKSRETVARYTVRNALFLLDRGIKAIVIACNTASAFGLEPLKRYFQIPILGVIEPGAKKAVATTRNKKVGVIGTEGTIRSGAYQKAIQALDPSIKIVTQACPLLVSMAEEGWNEGPIVDLVLEKYLAPFKESGILDTLILGCTHYPLFKKALAKQLGSAVSLVDSAAETALALKQILKDNNFLAEPATQGKITYLSTDSPERMKKLGSNFFGKEIGSVEKVDIGE